MATVNGASSPEGISSALDTDLYKLTMQCAVLQYFPRVSVVYQFTNRTPHMRLTRGAYHWLQQQIERLGNVRVSDEEIQWLEKTCRYLSEAYLQYLREFCLKPREQVKMSFTPHEAGEGDEVSGDLQLETRGLWVETILYEVPLLAMISEAYFKFVDKDWTYEDQVANAKQKGLKLLEAGCVFSEFGSRRRRDYKTHELVMTGLLEAQAEGKQRLEWKGKFTGTSNVHMAMRFGVAPIGTVAHEWFMSIAAITDNYADANETAMQYWTATFGRGVLSIALTDTFGTPAFLRAFSRPAPKSGTTDTQTDGKDPTYAQIFTGVRQDSGDPEEYIKMIRKFYTSQGIAEKKTVVFSDSLNVEKCIHYKRACDEADLTPSFGVGTFFTNDFKHISQPEEKSVPLNIVIKISEADGKKAIKLSDDVGKNMGDDELMRRIKREVGYEDKRWVEGDEAHRWDR